MRPVWIVVLVLGVAAIGGGAYLLYTQAQRERDQRRAAAALGASGLSTSQKQTLGIERFGEGFARGAEEGALGGPLGALIGGLGGGLGAGLPPLLSQGEGSDGVRKPGT
jgi:hypothetical protein